MQIQSITFNEQVRQQQQAEEKQELQNKIKLYSLLVALALFLVIVFILYRKNRHKHQAYTLLQKQKQEISMQKSRVEQTLEELKTRDLSDSVINSLPGIFYLYDEKGNFLRWNKEFEMVSGYSKEEITGMQPIDLFGENEKDYIISVLKKCNGRIWGPGAAAEILNINPSTLKSKMKKLGIKKEYME